MYCGIYHYLCGKILYTVFNKSGIDMMRKFFMAVLLLMTGLVHVSAQDADAKYAKDLLKAGAEVPNIVINDIISGAEKHLSDFKGKYVVLDFWASWCPDCRKDVPEMKRLYAEYGKKGVEFVGISFDKDEQIWRTFVKDNGMNWVQHREQEAWKNSQVAASFFIKWLPSVYVLDKEGKVVVGTVMIEKLDNVLGGLVGKSANSAE